jgi:hypothetical protein
MIIVCSLALKWVLLQLFPIPPLLEVFGTWNEPGRLAALRRASVGVYSEKRFMIEGWNVHALAVAFPAGGGVAGVKVLHAGIRPYAETQASMMYGLRLGKSVMAAAGFGLGGGKAAAEWGTVWETGRRCRIGMQCRMGASGAEYGGVSVTFGPEGPVEIELAAGKAAGQAVYGRAQVLYRPVDRLLLVGGYAAGPLFPYAGVGWMAGWWKMGVVGRWHPYLGISPGILIGWNGKGRD